MTLTPQQAIDRLNEIASRYLGGKPIANDVRLCAEVLAGENERLRAALTECAKDCELDPVLLDYVPTHAATVARAALSQDK